MVRNAKLASPLLLLLLTGCATLQSIGNTHGPAAHKIALLSHALSITFIIAIVVMWSLIAIALRKNPGSLAEHMPVDAGGGNAWVAIGGIAIPLLILSIFFFLGLDLLADFPIHGDHGAMDMNATTAKSKPDILIIGHQWWWEVHYLQDPTHPVISANEIHIPAYRPVNIELRTADVIHSFWVPSLHGKVDMLPGNVNFIRIEASDPGSYIGQCAVFCGKQHANMHILLIAQKPADFDAWLAHQAQPAVVANNPETTLGKEAFLAGPCSRCHTVRGIPSDGKFGPDLTHIGSRQKIGANSFPNNNAYLEGWITNAQALKPGCKMPAITQYNGAQLRSLVAYLRQLQ
jgi:cytochrome c oxidase subunit 2